MTYITAPATIDNQNKHDVSFALSDWLTQTRATSGRTQLRLRRSTNNGPGVYRVDSGVWSGAKGLDIDLNGCWLITPEGPGTGTRPLHPDINRTWPRNRSTLNISDNTTVHSSKAGARIGGGGRLASHIGTWNIGVRYESAYEAQHGIDVRGSNCVIDLSRIEVAWTYGDGVYVEYWAQNTEIKGVVNRAAALNERGGRVANGMWKPNLVPSAGIHHTGRQGIAQSGGKNLHVHDLTIWQVARSLFDFEPGAEGTLDGVLIERVTAGTFQNTWIAAAGNGYVNNLTAQNNVSVHRPMNIYCIDTRGHRRHNWNIIANRAENKAYWGSPIACMKFAHVDGVVIRDNYQRVQKAQRGRGTSFEDCTNVAVPDEAKQFVLV